MGSLTPVPFPQALQGGAPQVCLPLTEVAQGLGTGHTAWGAWHGAPMRSPTRATVTAQGTAQDHALLKAPVPVMTPAAVSPPCLWPCPAPPLLGRGPRQAACPLRDSPGSCRTPQSFSAIRMVPSLAILLVLHAWLQWGAPHRPAVTALSSTPAVKSLSPRCLCPTPGGCRSCLGRSGAWSSPCVARSSVRAGCLCPVSPISMSPRCSGGTDRTQPRAPCPQDASPCVQPAGIPGPQWATPKPTHGAHGELPPRWGWKLGAGQG